MPQELDRTVLRRCADVLLPSALTALERDAAVDAFLRWVRGYRAQVDMDHGYGFTRLRQTEASPVFGYERDLEVLRAAAERDHDGHITALDDATLRALVGATIEAAAPEQDSLPSRPDSSHVLIGLMTHYFRSPEASDRCYEANIRREICRGLFTDLDGLDPRAGD